ncbi:MAG TPA: DUF3667 domain-containing protein [Gammaproteobacteria bacterium]|nr:DUF3667 domain-containing protein [Gammaproteobacteria bacterium]
MTDPTEAVADVVTGALIASAVESRAGSAGAADSGEAHACLNCGAVLTGAFCAACGQPAHIHRSFLSLGHDILHGVFHFDTKLWRTLPELVLRPGRLTRRYIDGERAKFISPMALYLLTVFLMYAVFSFTGGVAPSVDPEDIPGGGRFKVDNSAAIDVTQQRIDELEAQLEAPDLSAQQRAELEARRTGLQTSLEVMQSIGRGDWANVERIQETVEDELERARERQAEQPAGADAPAEEDTGKNGRLESAIREINENPGLMAYKLKTNGYKFSWMLVPLSIPFMWPLFFWKRNVKAYDHAVFVTYSISFMMLLLIFVSLLGLAGLGSGWIAWILIIATPLHMYKQLRGTYGSSRFGALMRVWYLLFAALFVLAIYAVILLFIGALD